MAAPTDTPSAFRRLPAELLISILEQKCSEPDCDEMNIVDFATLKSLRLACRQYAYLPILLEDVFQRIRIEASPDQVEVAELLDLSCLKPHVRAITMVPSKYSWTMTEGKFKEIIWAPRVEEILDEMSSKEYQIRGSGGDLSSLPKSGGEEIKELGLMGFIQKHTDGQMPFTDGEASRGFEQYMKEAQRTREMYELKQVDRAWARVLAELSEIESFNIGIWDFNGGREQDWKAAGCEVQIHRHNHDPPGHSHAVCRQLQEPVGEALFRAAISSLIAARSSILHLEVECVLDSDFTWADDGTLDGLDLSKLQSLTFDPVGADWREMRHWSGEFEATANVRCGLGLVTLLRKCSSSLVELAFFPEHGGNYLVWPPAAPNQPPRLPVLDSITTGTSLDLSAFSCFLLQSPALVYLQLNGCGGDYPWRELWDAIRNHPNRMQLDFESLPCNEYAECSVHHHTGEASKANFKDDVWENIQYSLENYLSKRRHWDRTLNMWFGDEDESSENDSDTDDQAIVSGGELNGEN